MLARLKPGANINIKKAELSKKGGAEENRETRHKNEENERVLKCSHQSDQQMVENPICRFLSEVLPKTAGSGTTLDSNLINMAHEAPPFTATNHHPTVAGRPFKTQENKTENKYNKTHAFIPS
jgi:hypothetical protein